MSTLRQEMFKVNEATPEVAPKFNNRYPFQNMKVNTYFFVESISSIERMKMKKNVMNSAHRFGRQYRMMFSCKDVPNGFQVWRIK